jgi:glycosyltransferase involved in cell wall biosynthesis
MKNLAYANTLLREGKYQEAFEVFSELRNNQPGFTPYEYGYAVARKHLAELKVLNSQPEGGHFLEAVHPDSQPINTDSTHYFVVITPVLNGEAFIEATLKSVLNQAGDFFIDYLIKDAESSDNTLAILSDFGQRISLGLIPLQCNGIRFRVKSSPDKGLYDAIDYGFRQSQQLNRPNDIFTYINSDDVFVEDAFSLVVRVMDATPVRWLCGQINVIDAHDKLLVKPKFPLAYAREDIRAGLHDGRTLYSIQQEGSFWTRELYDLVGGVNSTFKLAGDFDLWQRFALYTELLALSINLASFRSHRGQLSSQIDNTIKKLITLSIIAPLNKTIMHNQAP